MSDIVNEYIVNLIEKKAALPTRDLDHYGYMKSGHVDSIGIIKFVPDIEAKFEIEISDSDMESSEFRIVGGQIQMVRQKLATH